MLCIITQGPLRPTLENYIDRTKGKIMGCDIHCYVEKKEDGKWNQIDGFVSDYYRNGHDYFGKDEYTKAASPLDCRNYSIFAVLANVRNGYGFAGCDTGDAVEPIADPRGLPADVSPNIKEASDGWDCDGHSHSWVTAREIKARLDEGRSMIHRGWVGLEGYKTFLEKGSPDSWSKGVGGGGVVCVGEEEMKSFIKDGMPKGEKPYCKVQWTTSEKDYCSSLFEHTLDQLMERSDTDGSDVRLVFWFDS
jgi:hypothetical protein